jgi:lysozyme family protein
MNIRMPNGKILQNVPEGTPWEEIQAVYSQAYPDVKWDDSPPGEEPVTIPRRNPRLGKVTGLDDTQTGALLKTLRDRESSDNYAHTGNSNGFIGGYRLSAEELANTGDMDPDKFKEWKASGYPGGQKAYVTNPDNWAFEGGKDSWLTDKEAQDASAVKLFNNIDTSNTKGMDPSNLSGYLMAAYLGGVPEASRLILDPEDISGNTDGINMQEYFALGKAANPRPEQSEQFKTFMKSLKVAEGGFVDNPTDKGGKTKFGISQRAFPDVDIKNLTWEGAQAIYYKNYYEPIKGDQLPAKIAKLVLDYGVNSGVSRAVKDLQKLLRVTVDGKMGPKTIEAIMEEDEDELVKKYIAARRKNYERIIKNNPSQKEFKKGWENRMVELEKETAPGEDFTPEEGSAPVPVKEEADIPLNMNDVSRGEPTNLLSPPPKRRETNSTEGLEKASRANPLFSSGKHLGAKALISHLIDSNARGPTGSELRGDFDLMELVKNADKTVLDALETAWNYIKEVSGQNKKGSL